MELLKHCEKGTQLWERDFDCRETSCNCWKTGPKVFTEEAAKYLYASKSIG